MLEFITKSPKFVKMKYYCIFYDRLIFFRPYHKLDFTYDYDSFIFIYSFYYFGNYLTNSISLFTFFSLCFIFYCLYWWMLLFGFFMFFMVEWIQVEALDSSCGGFGLPLTNFELNNLLPPWRYWRVSFSSMCSPLEAWRVPSLIHVLISKNI